MSGFGIISFSTGDTILSLCFFSLTVLIKLNFKQSHLDSAVVDSTVMKQP